ncbi:MAG: fibronectin type III domain-containing protein [Lacibacter sp.]
MEKVLLNFDRLGDGNLESKTHTILSNMSGNPYFPTPVPALTDVTTAATDYSSALIDAKSGSRTAIANKNNMREALTVLLRSLANYVNFVADGDATKLLSSGFDVSKETVPSVITKPENLQVMNGANSGELEVMVNRVKGATAYLHEYTTDDTAQTVNWVSVASTSRRVVFSNLLPGSKYYCRVGAVGPKGQLVYSDAMPRIVI